MLKLKIKLKERCLKGEEAKQPIRDWKNEIINK